MAGERLSSRQKMIGMMYLVLTAMLALQVSSSVLDKFILLSISIDKSRNLQLQHNKDAITSLKRMVSDMGNRLGDVQVFDQVLDIHNHTLELVQYIDGLKNQLIDLEGGIDATTKLPKGLKSDAQVAHLMINNGEGSVLKNRLNKYIEQVSFVTKKKYPSIAFDAKDHDFFSHDPNQSGKDFVTLNFDHIPLGTALATLSQFASEVVTAETDSINILGSSIGSSDVKFDTLKLLANTKSHIVAAGSKYEADLILAASSSAVSPDMFVDGKPIRVEDGVGKIAFTTTPGAYNNDGFAKKTFKAEIKLKSTGGQESIITENIEYLVAQPVIQIKSAAVQALYRNCGNDLDIQVPSLGIAYKPRFTAYGGEIILGNKKGVVTIIPKNKEVKLSVYNGDCLIGTESFLVKDIPDPVVCITSMNKSIDMKLGVPAPGPRKLEAKVIPDKYFQEFLPKDARYKIFEWVVTLARGSRPVEKIEVKGEVADLRKISSLAKPGDRLLIEIKKIARTNFKNEVEITSNRSFFNIPLN
ncbi:gliding motility protein GldM [Cardinium endosymbiont of Culicoides punctatus]|uniref:type IX secretion system motor protein PorM/GldM n=1 Tax=Cardinium endosymbiont of Culicoides punctatus TaxID=2304601 RepID=UPI001058D4C6|nr:gliding motility protein GldM [Cardinium endosymbiont of Culicoides punctatus]TDG95750.1 hypothetical protein CCPUN_00340 [Cardinium endosymbiont of Culicoides punctatus]